MRSEAVTDIGRVEVARRVAAVGGRIVDLLQAASIRWLRATGATSAGICVVEFLLERLDVLGVALRRHGEVRRMGNWRAYKTVRG